ncbi:MAG: 2-hydroxychromene-2-carboxylate isomerase [Pseudomonadales bacterium]|nr:2-hydroxychromene-2-carboxylate isomerase [Pseudomonadales bacterium]
MNRIEFWFEFASTYSYPTAMRIEAVAEKSGVQIVWRPFLLGPVFRKQGWDDSPFNLYPAKGAYMWRDLQRVCDRQGLPFNKPSAFPRNGLLAARTVCRFADEAWVPEFVRQIYRANFELDLDISSRDIVSQCLVSLGQNPEEILEKAEDAESKEKLKQQTERAEQLGIFGAPSFTVDGELFWGNDRLEAALEWAGGVQ